MNWSAYEVYLFPACEMWSIVFSLHENFWIFLWEYIYSWAFCQKFFLYRITVSWTCHDLNEKMWKKFLPIVDIMCYIWAKQNNSKWNELFCHYIIFPGRPWPLFTKIAPHIVLPDTPPQHILFSNFFFKRFL